MIQDLDSERAIISGLLQYGNDAFLEIAQFVKSETFTDHIFQAIFLSIEKSLEFSKKVEIPLLFSSAKSIGLDNILNDNKTLILELKDERVELDHIRIHGKRIAKLSLARLGQSKLLSAATALKNITGDETATQILSVIEKPGYDVQNVLNSFEHENGQLIGEGIEEWFEELLQHSNIEVGVPTGFKEFDKAIGGGLRRGGYTLLAARPKSGKSSTAINIALYIAEKIKIPVLYLDTEMIPKEHWPRMTASKTSIPINTIERSAFKGNKMFTNQIREVVKKIKTLPITHENVSGKSFDEILAIARRWVMKKVGFENGKTKNCVIIYDYFKLMDDSSIQKNMQEWQVIGFNATKLSDFLREMDVPCLALVQLNKEKSIAQSDRLVWFAFAVALLMSKTSEEIVTEGYENGNRKIVMPDNYMRFGSGLDPDDWININFNGECCQVEELGRALEAKDKARIGKSGFDIDDSDVDF